MTTVVSIEVFWVFVIAAAIFGGIISPMILVLIMYYNEKEEKSEMQKENNPCFNCTDRKTFCHIGCEREKEYTEKRKAEKEKIISSKQGEEIMGGYQREKSNRFRNYKTGQYWGK